MGRNWGVENKVEVNAREASVWLCLVVLGLGLTVLAFVLGLIW